MHGHPNFKRANVRLSGRLLHGVRILSTLGTSDCNTLLCTKIKIHYVCIWRDIPPWARASTFTRFLDQTHRRTTVGRTPLAEWRARRRDLYLTTHNTHNKQTSIPPVGFETQSQEGSGRRPTP